MSGSTWLNSLRLRLTVLSLLAFLVGLYFAGGFVLNEHEASLRDNLDSSLITRADDIVALLEQGRAPQNLGISSDEDTLAVVLDTNGNLLTTTDGFGDPVELQMLVGPPEERGITVTLGTYRETEGAEWMHVVHTTGPQGEAVYVGQSYRRIDAAVDDLASTLLIAGIALSIIAAATTGLVAWRALRPVEAIRHQAAEISLTNLDRRIPEPRRNDEMGQLARTFNAMLARLETSAERQRQLVADVAHELRSPLTGISTQLEVDLTHPEQADWPTTAGEALDETRRLQALIDDLLLLAEIDSGAPGPEPRLVDLDQIVLDTIARTSARTTKTIDHAQVSAGLVCGVPSQLERSVQNLIDNAVRHAAEKVTVILSEDGDMVTLTVTDDGPGIPADQHDKIFERFYRLQDDRDRQTGGTGLGLAITRETITAHRGAISVHQGQPRGTSMQVTLPSA